MMRITRRTLIYIALVELAVILVLAGNVAYLIVAPEMRDAKPRLTRQRLAEAALAYPSWRAAHAESDCPRDVTELGQRRATDIFGTAIQLVCGTDHGNAVLVLRSAGWDRKHGTDDDITVLSQL